MSKLNVLLITSDQQHWSTLGHLNPAVKTPALDQLAQQGTTFTNAYCPNPTCTPTRASLITGKYPSQHGAYSLGTKLPEHEPTLGDAFGSNGYRTALVGKAHFQQMRTTDEFSSLESYPTLQDLDFWRQFDDPFYGFDHVELARNHADEYLVGQHYAIWMEEKGLTNWRDYFHSPTGNNDTQRHTWGIPEEFHYNTWITERTNALLSQYQADDEPFFLWASFFDPHPPYLVPKPWDTMYDPADVTVPHLVEGEHDHNPPHFQMTQEQAPDFSAWAEPNGSIVHGFHSHLHDRDELAKDIACYYGMVSCMDNAIGNILNHLDALGLADNTLVVFTSDHGHYYGHHGLIAKGPFHYDDGIRVPMIARLPDHIPAGMQQNTLQSLVDYAPTFLSFCGIDIPSEMSGHNQQAVWCGDSTQAREHVIIENRHQPTTVHMKTYIDTDYKLTVYFNRDYGEIFDRRADPTEINNLWADVTLRHQLMERMLRAEMLKEEPLTDVQQQLANKSQAMYRKTMNHTRMDYQITFDPTHSRYELFNLWDDPHKTSNLWHSEKHQHIRAELVQMLLWSRWASEPLWMPRVGIA